MQRLFSVLVLVVILALTGYWFHTAHSGCVIPIEYDIGSIDARFEISEERVRVALADAESLWENATGKNLFTHTPGTSFRVDFVYDDRQELTEAERDARNKLDQKEGMSETIRAEHERLTSEYATLKNAYEAQAATYEEELREYNEEVERWNEKGGAPQEEYEDLNRQQRALGETRDALNVLARDLNTLATRINELGEEGNERIESYNEEVKWYNSIFGQSREFTQGDYQGDRINIYQFDTETELRVVLAHELGHALGLDHVENADSLMFHTMDGRLSGLTLTEEDMKEFARVCGLE